METLMELVESCNPTPFVKYGKQEENARKSDELMKLGFTGVAKRLRGKSDAKAKLAQIAKLGYIVITDEKIQAFLDKKAERYNSKHRQDPKYPGMVFVSSLMNTQMSNQMREAVQSRIPENLRSSQPHHFEKTLTAQTVDYASYDQNTIGMFTWEETLIKNYAAIPPKEILETFKEHKDRNVFDEFTVASVSEVHDPLLLGRVYDDPRRWFIAQWGDDVQIDDLI